LESLKAISGLTALRMLTTRAKVEGETPKLSASDRTLISKGSM
jgi:hypothetical protein